MKNILFILVAGLLILPSYGRDLKKGSPLWCNNDENLGWDFYCDTNPEKKNKDQKKADKGSSSPAYPYTKQVEKERLDLEEAKAKAILEPTVENLVAYMTMQQKTMGRASDFTKTWQEALIEKPRLDYTLKRPQGTLAKRVWYDERNKDIDNTIKSISERYGIMWFYQSTCPYCHKYAPIIKTFGDKYNISVMAISMDGGPIPYFPDAVMNQGQAEAMGIAGKPVPATVLFDTKTQETYALGFGVMTQNEIMNRIFQVVNKEIANDW